MASRDYDNELGILLMGVTGHGKSATGNSILLRREFESLGGGTSVTKDYHVGYTRFQGRTIKVVDIPGFADTDESTSEGQHELVINALTKVLAKFPNGFHAVLLVVSYTNRLTDELQQSMENIFSHFGQDAFGKHGVLVLTCGDSFERDYGSDASVHKAVSTGYRRILRVCGGRCVLFDNVTRDEGKRQMQLMQLLNIIDDMDTGGARYIPTICRYSGPDRVGYERDRRRAADIERISCQLGLLKDDLYRISSLPDHLRLSRIEDMKSSIYDIADQINHLNISDPVLQDKLSSCLKFLNTLAATKPREGNTAMKQQKEMISGMQEDLDKQTKGSRFWNAIKKGLGFIGRMAVKALKFLIF